MKYLASLLFVFGLCHLSGAQTPKFASAVAYNDYIIALQQKIGVSINDYASSIDSGSLSYSTTKLNGLTKTIEDAIAKVKAMPAYKGNTRFRDATVQLFVFYKSCSQNEYKEMMNLILGPEMPENLPDMLNDLQNRITEKENKLDKVFQAEQEKFAKDNNFTLTTDQE